MLTLVLHPMLAGWTEPSSPACWAPSCAIARHAPIDYIAVVGMVVAPVVALVALDAMPRG